MKKLDGIWIKALVIIGWIAIAIVLLSKLDIDGEHVERVQASEMAVLEAPEAEPKEIIIGKPALVISYVYTPDEPVIYEDDEEQFPTRDEVYCLARLVHGEASVCSTLVKTGVIWTVLNRVDSEAYPNTIREVVTQKGQFAGFWRETDTPYTVEEWKLCYEIVKAWRFCDDRYRTIPSNYLYFRGSGTTNYFTTYFTKSLKEAKRNAWQWTMPNEYEGGNE